MLGVGPTARDPSFTAAVTTARQFVSARFKNGAGRSVKWTAAGTPFTQEASRDQVRPRGPVSTWWPALGRINNFNQGGGCHGVPVRQPICKSGWQQGCLIRSVHSRSGLGEVVTPGRLTHKPAGGAPSVAAFTASGAGQAAGRARSGAGRPVCDVSCSDGLLLRDLHLDR